MNMSLRVDEPADSQIIDDAYNSLFIVLNSLRLAQNDTKLGFDFSFEDEFQLGNHHG